MEGAFVGAEVGQVQGCIGADDADEGDVGKMQTLGEDLRAGEDVDFAFAEIPQDAVVVGAFHRVAIDAGDFGVREFSGDFLFEALRAEANHNHSFAAEGAFFGDEGLRAAVMADCVGLSECVCP